MKYSAGYLVVAALLCVAVPAMAAKVTGSVSEVSPTNVVIKKGRQKLDMARDASTRVEGDLRKGAKVTVEYTMTATSIEVKSTGRKARATKKKPD